MPRERIRPALRSRSDLFDVFERVLTRGVLIESSFDPDHTPLLPRSRKSIVSLFRAEVSVVWRRLFRDDDRSS